MLWYVIAVILGLVIGTGITYVICRILPQEKVRQYNISLLEDEER
jgi:membrane protein DedA with SNARE-associated domain